MYTHTLGFPGGSVVKNLLVNAGDLGSIPGSGRPPGEGNSNPLQYSCLENPMDGGAWWATVHGVAQSRTRLKQLSSSSSSHYFSWEIPWTEEPGSPWGSRVRHNIETKTITTTTHDGILLSHKKEWDVICSYWVGANVIVVSDCEF